MKRFEPVMPKLPAFIHGGDYNPEQWMAWKDTIWKEDMRLAKLAGMNSLSVGIFSWSSLEPEEGRFHFEWLDEIMDMMAENGLTAVLATPSAARPAWMSQKYPEVLRTNGDRSRNLHGGRHNHCMSSPVYREKTQRINSLLAQRYKNHPALGMWHLSNEISGFCHCELCQENFRNYLRDRYGTLEALNQAWWTTFWSHTYTSWSQIESPGSLGETNTHGLVLDWKRFTTENHMDFLLHEMEPLREHTPDIPCTTNLMASYEDIDYVRFSQIFDLVSWDNYPQWAGTARRDKDIALETGFYHDLIYGLKRRPFMIMESCPSATNWQKVAKLKRPGAHLLQSVQAIAHGSDSIQYFQFRKSRGSSEKMHGAVVDHEGSENTRVFREVANSGKYFASLDPVIGAGKASRIALIHDYVNSWAINELQGALRDKKQYRKTLMEHYSLFWNQGIPVDIIDETCSLEGYDIVLAPMAYMLREGFAGRVSSFVEAGGTFVTTYLSGYVNDSDLCFLGGFPGPLKEILGIWDEELDSLYPEDTNTIHWNGKAYKAFELCEIIHAWGAEILGTYGGDFYADTPALTVNSYGRGKAYYIAARTETDFLADFYGMLLEDKGILPPLEKPLPGGVNVQVRTDGETEYLFLMNFTEEAQKVDIGDDFVALPPHGVKTLDRTVM